MTTGPLNGAPSMLFECGSTVMKRRARSMLRFNLRSITGVGTVVEGASLRLYASYSYDPAPNDRVYPAVQLLQRPSFNELVKPASYGRRREYATL